MDLDSPDIMDASPALAMSPQNRPVAPALESEEALLRAGVEHHRAGRPGDAIAHYDALLERNPDQRHALMLLGILRAETGEIDAAEALFGRLLRLTPEDPLALHNLGKLQQRRGDDTAALELFQRVIVQRQDFAPTYNDIGVSLHRLGHGKMALTALDQAIAIDPDYAMAHSNRGLVLAEASRHAEAAEAFRRVLALTPDATQSWYNLAVSAHALNKFSEAEQACRRALALDPDYGDAYLQLVQTLDRAHRPQEAECFCTEWARRQGVVVRPCITGAPQARVLLIGGSRLCNVPTHFLFNNRRFETILIHLLPEADSDANALLARLPPFDVVFNAIADADYGAPFLAQAAALCRQIDRPILNSPDRIPRTRRDLISNALSGIPNLVVPKIERLSRGALAARAAETRPLDRDMLVRPVGSHGGNDLNRIASRAELADYVRAMPFDEYYLSEYCDYRGGDGYFRKYRFVFIDREVFPYHLAISRDWLVHYFRADMSCADWMKREEEAFLTDYRGVFPGALAEAVREAARRLDLDYGGMDCGITQDGRVLVFEANASMLVHLNDSREDFAYKHAHVPKIFEAMARLVERRMTAGTRRPS